MKINLQSSHSKILAGAITLLGLLLLASNSPNVLAQTNTFPATGNVGVGTTTPSNALVIGTDIGAQANPTSSLVVANPSNNSLITVGQSSTNRIRMKWNYNATGSLGFGIIGTQDINNSLVLQDMGGKVGIGTLTPGYKLDLQGGQINSSGGLCIAGDCKTAWSQVGGGGGSPWLTFGANTYFNNGNVGIGTNTPNAKLVITSGNVGLGTNDIEAWTAAASVIESTTTSILFGHAADLHLISNTYHSNGWKYKANGPASNYYLYNGAHAWRVAAPGTADALINWNEAMTLQNSGNFGIGTTGPLTRTHVVKPYSNDGGGGTTAPDTTWGVYKSDMQLLLDTGGPRTINRGGGIGFSNSDGFVLGAIKGAATNSTGGQYGGYLGFYTTGSTSGGTVPNGYERMRITESGNVGVGTTAPAFKLDVNGEINATGLRINGTPISGGGPGSAVSSVFGRIGAVVAGPNDYTWAQIDKSASSLANLTTRSAGDLSSGTLPNAVFPAILPGVSGANLTNLSASSIVGIVPATRLGTGIANVTTVLRGDNTWGPGGGTAGAVDSVYGRTGAVAAQPGDYNWSQITKTTSSLADITTRSAGDLSSGTLPNAVFPAILPGVSGANLTNLTAANLTGTVAAARLGTGASGTNFLRSDNTWATPTGSGSSAVDSVYGRTGVVAAQPGDYNWSQITKTTSSLADITTRSAGDLSSGTLPNSVFPAVLPAVSGANLTSLNALNLTGTVPTARLGTGTANVSTFLRGDNTWGPSGSGSSQWTTIATTNLFYNTGSVGIGTDTPASLLDVKGSANNPFRVRDSSDREYFSTTTRTNGAITIPIVSLGGGRLTVDNSGPEGGNDTLVRHAVNSLIFSPSDNIGLPGSFLVRQKGGSFVLQIDQNTNGNVGVGTAPSALYKLDINGNTHITGSSTVTGNSIVTGDITVNGNINAKYQDVAEWVESSQELPAGTVVVLDHTKSNQVIASSETYDTRVAGVISAQPGITLGVPGENKVLVATTGRVKIKVDASRGPIRVGDLLVTSNIPGLAMKSRPVNIGGVRLHRPGTLIGKALEPLEKGSGEILVLLSLQ